MHDHSHGQTLDPQDYLRRIGLDPHDPAIATPTAAALRILHHAHLLTVPFENLDIHRGQPIALEAAALWDKIVRQKRGGFCFELNGTFAQLLQRLGFRVELLAAQFVHDDGLLSPVGDHALLRVWADGVDWVVDVGFGDWFREPLRWATWEQVRLERAYRLVQRLDVWWLEWREPAIASALWRPKLRFTCVPCTLADFAPMCHHHQTSPHSLFTQKQLCSRFTPTGRMTVTASPQSVAEFQGELINTIGTERAERPLRDHQEWVTLLWDKFGIRLGVVTLLAGGAIAGMIAGAIGGGSGAIAQEVPAHQALRREDLRGVARPETLPAARVRQTQEQRDRIRPERFDLDRYPVTDAHETHWRQTLWATAILEPGDVLVGDAIAGILALSDRPDLSAAQQRTITMAFQVGTQLYLADAERFGQIGDRLRAAANTSPVPLWAVHAAAALAQAHPDTAAQWRDRLQTRFPQWQRNLDLWTTVRDLDQQINPTPLPPLADWLTWQIAPGQPQLYIFCRRDRGQLCQAILKDGSGRWVQRDAQGRPGVGPGISPGIGSDSPELPANLWHLPLTARSLHGLRWHFIRGQSPLGVYRLEGVMPRPQPQEFRAYGQFPLVKVFMPFEAGVRAFVPPRSGSLPPALDAYRALLPPTWRGYFPAEQTYWAGRLGRSLIRIHGTGEPADFFANSARYPESLGWNPAIGCFSTREDYDAAGQLVRSDQQELLQILYRVAGDRLEGYVLAIEVPDALPLIPIVIGRSPVAADR